MDRGRIWTVAIFLFVFGDAVAMQARGPILASLEAIFGSRRRYSTDSCPSVPPIGDTVLPINAEQHAASNRTKSGDREGSKIPQAVGQSTTTAWIIDPLAAGQSPATERDQRSLKQSGAAR